MSESLPVARAPGVDEKGNTQSMDFLESLEIYIPVEAEVKNICLWSLPNSMLKRMGLPLYDTEGSRKLAESPEGIWICPAVLRKKGQRPTSSAENSMTENMSSLIGKAFRGGPGPFRMSFVSSNHAAYNILQDAMPTGQVSEHTSRSSQLPPGSAPQTYQDAIIIYRGRIYLSIRKPSRSQHPQGTHGPKPASQFSLLSTSDVSSKSQTKRQSPEASLDPEDKHLKRTRWNVTVPQISSNQPEDRLIKVESHSTTYKRQSPEASLDPADKHLKRTRWNVTVPQISSNQPEDRLIKVESHSTTYKELQNQNGPKKRHTTCKVTQSENTIDVTRQGRNAPSAKTAHSVPQSTGEQPAEKVTCHESAWFQLRGEQEEVVSNDTEIQKLVSEEADDTSQNNDMDRNKKPVSGECDNIVGVVEHSSSQSWSQRASQGAACASTSLQQEYDELAQEEEISQMKAKLRLTEAVLNNLHSSL